MKTKKQTKQRKQARDFEVANRDLKGEYEDVMLDDGVLDEDALILCLMEEDE